MGLRDPGAEEKVENLAWDLSDGGDGGPGPRRGGSSHQAQYLPRPATTAPKDIQAAAAQAAAATFSDEAEPSRSSKLASSHSSTNLALDNNSNCSASTARDGDDDTFFDLPDLPLDGTDQYHSNGFCYYASSTWQLAGAEVGFRLEDPFLWDCNY
ncbi:ethylene-responsive transcription factor erf035 [Phtheirospermum japonicum]|uniref:Ethylene-responsive transcription factor erf035 n=1 Tax=Phtheirospermum japonicum TaxID=374723 RepID=A0A830B5G9_9LAMI|nr:ethylene-responsive transcription factor erf035 [Phtheirospermum japonicum]